MSTETLRPRDCRNILKLFREIPADVIAEGREWYPRARALAEELADTHGHVSRHYSNLWDAEVRKAAAVIAVLSPRVNWERNKMLARLVYDLAAIETWTVDMSVEEVRKGWGYGLSDGAGKAFRILVLNEDPDDVVGGPKVRQFWQTIVDPTDSRAVVIDRHAIDVAFGRILSDAERGRAVGPAGAYDHLSQLYRNAARIISRELAEAAMVGPNSGSITPASVTLTPAELQAITWTYWRRTRAANAKANRKTEGK